MVSAIQSTGLETAGKAAGPVDLLAALFGGGDIFSGLLDAASANAAVPAAGGEKSFDDSLLTALPFVPAFTPAPVPATALQSLSSGPAPGLPAALQPAAGLLNGALHPGTVFSPAASASTETGEHPAGDTKSSTGLTAGALQALAALQSHDGAPQTAPVTAAAASVQPVKDKEGQGRGTEHTIKSLLLSQMAKVETPAQPVSPLPARPDAFAQTGQHEAPLVFAALRQADMQPSFSFSHDGKLAGGAALNDPALAMISPVTQAAQEMKPVLPAISTFTRLMQEGSIMPVAEQVLVHMKSALRDGSSRINIQLQPEELGRIEVRLHVGHDGKTGAIITAENKDTLALLQRDMRGLQQALEDAGLKTDAGSLSFNLRGDNSQQQAQSHERTVNTSMVIKVDAEGAAVAATSGKTTSLSPSGVDITV